MHRFLSNEVFLTEEPVQIDIKANGSLLDHAELTVGQELGLAGCGALVILVVSLFLWFCIRRNVVRDRDDE